VGRGGGWYYYADYCRAAVRFDFSPDVRFDDLGFRLLRTAK
jgi:formylglycine-generating enzyme required for sulfatase activity